MCEATASRIVEKIDSMEKALNTRLDSMGRELKEIKTVLRGSEGREGLVADVGILNEKAPTWDKTSEKVKQLEANQRIWNRFSNIVVGIVAAIITAALTQLLFG